MPIWLEVFVLWIAIGTVLNVFGYIVLRKRGYFQWLKDIHNTLAYQTGYKDAQKASITTAPPYTNNIIVPHLRQLREHGVRDDRYNLTKEC